MAMTETLRHMEAFEYYYGLGLDRSYNKVAEQFGVATQSVEKWGKEFQWRKRVITRDLEAGKKLRERNETSLLDEKENYRKIIKASLASYIEELKKGHIKVTKVNDVINLIELDLKLMGLTDNGGKQSDETTNTINQLLTSVREIVEGDTDGNTK